MSWWSSDNFFVNSKLEVFSVNLFSEPLELMRSKVVVYDGPKGDDFKRFLRSKNFRVNRQGKAIVRVQKHDEDGEFLECQYDSYVLQTVVPLGPFGFPNIPLPKPQVVNGLQNLLDNTKAELAMKNDAFNELQILLDNTKAELAMKNDASNELQSLLDNTKAELSMKNDAFNELQSLLDNSKAELAKNNDALRELMKQKIDQDWNTELSKKNDAFDELQSLLDYSKAELAKKNDVLNELIKQKIDQDWNTKQFRLTIVAITNSMKRIFVDFGLEPPTSGDPESVLRFLEMLHDLILHKEFNSTFLVAANEILTSIANIFDKRSGLSIGMETNCLMTPTHVIKSLFTLRCFMDSHFFIDGSAIVRDLHLMNEEDVSVIFRDSIADATELKQKKIGAKSIDNIDKKHIFYGYFNIPKVGMFKGVLTRVYVNLPDEIMVKLRAGKHNLNDNMFWFVNGNGAGIFQKETLSPEDVKFNTSRFLGCQTNFLEFFLRMNRTFVNKNGTYLKFDFVATKRSKGRDDNSILYYDKDFVLYDPFKLVQFDGNECGTGIVERKVFFPGQYTRTNDKYATWIVNEALGYNSAFEFKDFCFIGKITKASGTFRKNALVNVFFEQSQHGDNCYVDALATTFFVLKIEQIHSWINEVKTSVQFIE